MDEEYFMQEMADIVIEDLKEAINIEKEIITSEHNFHEKILSYHNVVMHLDERVHHNEDMQTLNTELTDIFAEMEDLVENFKLNELTVEKEQENLLIDAIQAKSKKDADKFSKDLLQFNKDEIRTIKIQIKGLHELHSIFKRMKKIIEKYDNSFQKQGKTEDYFMQIYLFACSYESFLKKSLVKEEILNKKIEQETKKQK